MIDVTKEIDAYLTRLFPIARSITGDGNRQTLRMLQEIIPLTIKEYPSGEKVYDWVIPKEWNIKDGWIKNSKGAKVVDFRRNNLHVLNYSIPVHKKMKFKDIQAHLHTLENMPDAIPYRTTYYHENWGFCLSHDDFKKYFREDEEYEIFIDSELKEGSLTIGELVIEGKSKKEVLLSTYICHPSLANDNLSGFLLTAFLAKELLKKERNFSYRIVFVPETIGAVAYCAKNEEVMKNIKDGFVITTVGGPGKLGYKQSFDSSHCINKIIEQTFTDRRIDFVRYPFDVHGSDERQYSSQGFRINVATICKDKYYEYPVYHTSLDNLSFVKAHFINETLNVYLDVIERMDKNIVYRNMYPNCEVMLSKRELYPKIGGGFLLNDANKMWREQDAFLGLLFYCDGKTGLFDISQKTGIDIMTLYECAVRLQEKGLLQ